MLKCSGVGGAHMLGHPDGPATLTHLSSSVPKTRARCSAIITSNYYWGQFIIVVVVRRSGDSDSGGESDSESSAACRVGLRSAIN